MRDMMASPERLDAHPSQTGETVRRAAAAAFEALPAILLAAALLMPALAAIAAKSAEQQKVTELPVAVEVSQLIAAQGNQALVDIRAEARESMLANLTLPTL
jgi:hypothetical protein